MSNDKDILPKINIEKGGFHPINQTKDFILNILEDLGFTHIDGPEIETDVRTYGTNIIF